MWVRTHASGDTTGINGANPLKNSGFVYTDLQDTKLNSLRNYKSVNAIVVMLDKLNL
jgi:hypothetical protein